MTQYIRVRVVIQDKKTKELFPMMEDFVLTTTTTWKLVKKSVEDKYRDTDFEILKLSYKTIEESEFTYYPGHY